MQFINTGYSGLFYILISSNCHFHTDSYQNINTEIYPKLKKITFLNSEIAVKDLYRIGFAFKKQLLSMVIVFDLHKDDSLNFSITLEHDTLNDFLSSSELIRNNSVLKKNDISWLLEYFNKKS